MARRKRTVPRYQATLIGIGLLLAERRARKKVGRRLARPLGQMGKGLLLRRPGAYSPSGLATRAAWSMARRRMR